MTTEQDKSVQNILDSHVKDLKSKVPSFLSMELNTLPDPSKIFKDYRVTKDPNFKEASGKALNILQGYVHKVGSLNTKELFERKKKFEEKKEKSRETKKDKGK